MIKNKKGKRFGGFARSEWKNERKLIYDSDAFLFSLEHLEKYKILKPYYALFSAKDGFYLIYGNNLDGCGLYLDEDRYNKQHMPPLLVKENHSTKVYDIPSDCYLTGESCSEAEDIEVFQIIFS